MSDLISRQAAIDAIRNMCEECDSSYCGECNHIKIARITFNCETIEDADGTIYRKERKGKWIYEGIRGRFPACRCSVCGSIENADWAVIQDGANFCPHCGAKMDKEGEA